MCKCSHFWDTDRIKSLHMTVWYAMIIKEVPSCEAFWCPASQPTPFNTLPLICKAPLYMTRNSWEISLGQNILIICLESTPVPTGPNPVLEDREDTLSHSATIYWWLVLCNHKWDTSTAIRRWTPAQVHLETKLVSIFSVPSSFCRYPQGFLYNSGHSFPPLGGLLYTQPSVIFPFFEVQ